MSLGVLKAGTFLETPAGSSTDPFRAGRSSRIEALQREIDALRRDFQAKLDAEVARAREETERRAREEHGAALRAFREAAIALKRTADAGVQGAQHEIVTLAIAVAEKILRREIAADATFTASLVRRMLGRVLHPGIVRIRVHPTEHPHLVAERDAMQRETGLALELVVVADRRVERGGCILETPDFVIDGTLRGQLAAARAAMEAKPA
jgi:flagellar assembly protein FliH